MRLQGEVFLRIVDAFDQQGDRDHLGEAPDASYGARVRA